MGQGFYLYFAPPPFSLSLSPEFSILLLKIQPGIILHAMQTNNFLNKIF